MHIPQTFYTASRVKVGLFLNACKVLDVAMRFKEHENLNFLVPVCIHLSVTYPHAIFGCTTHHIAL